MRRRFALAKVKWKADHWDAKKVKWRADHWDAKKVKCRADDLAVM